MLYSYRIMGTAHRYRIAICVLAGACSGGKERVSESRQAVSSCTTLVASADTFIAKHQRNQNFGQRRHLRQGGGHESLVAFDLSSVPASASIDSATLSVFVIDDDSRAPVNLHRVTAQWQEMATTYKSFGQQFEATPIGGFTPTKDLSEKSIDVTAQVKRWITGAQPNYGVLLETASSREVVMVSREGGRPVQKPQLTVCYSTPDDHCDPNPCQNNGTCNNTNDSFTCDCQPGYTGTTCEQVIDHCDPDPCLNGGTCTSDLFGYACACPTGYTGTNCETLIDNCAGQPCQNDGVCVNHVGSYSCDCAIGWTGANCEILVDNCASGPCQNGGTCTNDIGTYTCSCPDGFNGTDCEINIDDCDPDPCLNGGTCQDGIAQYTCVCPSTWGGTNCEINLDLCAQNPCLNGAQCIDGYGVYTCVCQAGFTGTNCEIDINDCATNPCFNGGVCVDKVNSYACTCPPGYTGTNCETFGCATALDGTPCDDNNACTQSDSCQGGVCTGQVAVVCTAIDQCHAAGVCDPVTAVCSNPALGDGTSCSDGNG